MKTVKILKMAIFILVLLISRETLYSLKNSEHLRKTLITPHLEVPIISDQNIIFCSTFQIAWTGLKEDIIKEPLMLKKTVDFVPFLNKGLASEVDISEKDYMAMAGFVQDDIVGRINRNMQTKFAIDNQSLDPAAYPDPATIISYAFLTKDMQFENPFENFKQPLFFYTKTGQEGIAGFGVYKYGTKPEHSKIRGQIEVLNYENSQNFVIRLNSLSLEDEIILARIPPEATLLKTIQKVGALVSSATPEYPTDDDVLQIPKFDLSLKHSYSSLLGIHLANKGYESYFFAEASQNINFKLDECGARLESDAEIVLKKGPNDFRKLIFSGPFLIYLKKKTGDYPYLAIWVENSELFIKK